MGLSLQCDSPLLLDTLYRKFETFIPRNETAQPHSKFLHSCIWKRFIFIPVRSYLESLFSCIAWELSAQLQEQREGQETAAKQRLVAVPCPVLLRWRVHLNDRHTNFQFGKFLIINGNKYSFVVNFLFGLRVNEIPKKTFILQILTGTSFAMQSQSTLYMET